MLRPGGQPGDQQWAELSLRYFPWIAWGDEAAICADEWRHVMYIFTNPFYFIGYAFATLGALHVLAAYEADRRAAISRYRSALRMGATATVPELFSRAGATFAFDVGSARSIIFDSGTPIQGMTIDQASTQRRR